MASKPDCFGSFNFSSETCSTCSSDNLNCIIISLQQELCFSNAIQGDLTLCKTSACPQKINDKCVSARFILDKVKEKACFSEPSIKPECFDCKIFEDCEAAELMKQNFNLSIDKAKDLIKTQISEMMNEEGQCFGDFSFEEACWNECQWSVRCLKMSGIQPGKNCKFFDRNQGAITMNCLHCNFMDFCNEILEAKRKEEQLALESTKMFRNFYSVNQMREFAEVTNGK